MNCFEASQLIKTMMFYNCWKVQLLWYKIKSVSRSVVEMGKITNTFDLTLCGENLVNYLEDFIFYFCFVSLSQFLVAQPIVLLGCSCTGWRGLKQTWFTVVSFENFNICPSGTSSSAIKFLSSPVAEVQFAGMKQRH